MNYAMNSTYVFEQHLKRDVIQLANDIPDYTLAQNKLYEARELIETAMKSLPGASTFMDRQAIVANQMNNNQSASSFFGKSALVAFSSSIVDPIKNADKIAQQSYQLVKEASEICPDVPQIPSTSLQKGETNVVYILTTYRGYRLKIEYTLRTQVNPRLHGFENQLAMTKYHYEQRVIEWINHQILSLESYLRANGCLANENLEREISMLRMGSRAALAAVASETSGRVTVDDVLEISSASEHAILPEYEEHNRISMDESSTTTTSSSPRDGDHNMSFSTSTTVHDSCEPNIMDLPSYYPTSNPEQIDLPPPAYSR
ncbi:MAG: hypothetical protein EXX96DRAFT_593358 [Benjaminiella poitrasii]|nr:MAG: hypothetical protein EXX96DRAFT_593358 [Benjaminiella poitrasii]